MSDPKQPEHDLAERSAACDLRLVEALTERFRLAEQAAGGSELREAWVEALVAPLEQPLRTAARSVLQQLRVELNALGAPVTVAFLGPEGGLTTQIVRARYGGAAGLIECATIAQCLEEVSRGRAQYAVFPFESSEEGLSQVALDALAKSELSLIAEHRVTSRYHLVSQTGNLADVEKLYLTSSARAACAGFVGQRLAKAAALEVRSPALAVHFARSDAGSAAILPQGSELGDLQVVQANVGDEPDTRYRFGVAAERPAPRSGKDATAVLFSVDDAAGALFDVLRHFVERGVNLRLLQSRPVQGASWDYVFYAELSGHVTDRALVTAIESVKRTTRLLRVLGSFPSDG